ncbi:aspartyl/asparaginyl beta-hydroxylase domain-containing protein [Saccharobesus litoralis]|uniref:Aspartyl/asparaginyl beta-hydroxylase domain-containing protein n=1 Tax=Saccharobesus litoralis TaxID=2172099 RepID=A0A2S0VTU1_9ALTE|nr:aspartyl/asparaginyl beta-hydroxylase domain-containing protein [Saccharobesus litoralis]AWB67631.1 aspartyl/asparaginyl beta-hydroxylase domain-containing protein [Saccharobesus litoralis]
MYVYKFRGEARFGSLTEYLRKGWPIFAPLNVMLYLSTKKWAKKNYVSTDSFENLALLQQNWQVIAQEANALMDAGYFSKTTDKNNNSFYDVGFRTFYKYGWSKFYCSWYGTTLNSAREYCPQTVALLEQIPSVNGAMFTLLPAKSQLTRHSDPLACSLRYHLGLNTPNSDECFISVDGEKQSWRDGKHFMFDETFLHYVENNTDDKRLILMCDIERPMGPIGKGVNWCYKKIASLLLVPNLPGDQAGLFNLLFRKVTPFLARSKRLKEDNPKLYYPVKWLFNALLIGLLLVPIYYLITFLAWLF